MRRDIEGHLGARPPPAGCSCLWLPLRCRRPLDRDFRRTSPSDELVKLAEGADVLVHDTMYLPGVERLVARVPNAQALRRSILSHHTSAEDAGRVAQRAGVKTLVLSHLVPADDPEISDAMWLDAARAHFSGTVILGKDLLEV